MNRKAVQAKGQTTGGVAAAQGILQRKCACGNQTVAGGECEGCKNKRLELQRRAVNGASEPTEAPPIVHEVLRSPGQPLDAATRALMESRFAYDFTRTPVLSHHLRADLPKLRIGPTEDHHEHEAERIAEASMPTPNGGIQDNSISRGVHNFREVRVHVDAKAAESAQEINSLAYTVGEHIVFGTGQFSPQTPRGRKLLAHELTHVLQQRNSKSSGRVQRAPDVKKELESKYHITISKGDEEWSPADLEDLSLALSKLNSPEIKSLSGYNFIRWSTKTERAAIDSTYKDSGEDEVALHEGDLQKISLYNAGARNPEAKKDETGILVLLHEIGHAMGYVGKHKAGSRQLENVRKDILSDFEVLIRKQSVLTARSKEGTKEAFAEAFAIYKIKPMLLKKENSKLYNWFKKLNHLAARRIPEKR